MSITIPSMRKEIEFYKIRKDYFFRIEIENQTVEICIDQIVMSPITTSLIYKWIDEELKEIK